MIKVRFATTYGWLEATTKDLRTFYINDKKSKRATYYKHPNGNYYVSTADIDYRVDGIEIVQGSYLNL